MHYSAKLTVDVTNIIKRQYNAVVNGTIVIQQHQNNVVCWLKKGKSYRKKITLHGETLKNYYF